MVYFRGVSKGLKLPDKADVATGAEHDLHERGDHGVRAWGPMAGGARAVGGDAAAGRSAV